MCSFYPPRLDSHASGFVLCSSVYVVLTTHPNIYHKVTNHFLCCKLLSSGNQVSSESICCWVRLYMFHHLPNYYISLILAWHNVVKSWPRLIVTSWPRIHVQHSQSLSISSPSTATSSPMFIATCIGCFVLTPLPRMHNTLEQFHIHKLHAPTSFYTDKTSLPPTIMDNYSRLLQCWLCLYAASFILTLRPSHHNRYTYIIL